MIKIDEANQSYMEKWDSLIEKSINGTIFHRRDFLSYHGDKFKGKERFLMIFNGDSPLAQISFSVFENDGKKEALSPYGASYGGFVFQRVPGYKQGKEIVNVFKNYLNDNHIHSFRVIHPIACCTLESLDTFYFNLLETGFVSINRDISSVVRIPKDSTIMSEVSSNARNMARKAEMSNIVVQDKANIVDFWKVMDNTFAKHGNKPTHTLEQFMTIMSLLPDRVYVDVAYKDGSPIAGIGYFVINKFVNSSFYLCQDPEKSKYQGLSLLVLNGLKKAQYEGFSYFDFGTSTVNMIARENIFMFKENYTKMGMFRETFKWKA